jgi:predicted DNA-binding transcriptional regulator
VDKGRLAGSGILALSVLVAIAYALLLYLGYGLTLTIVIVSAALYVLLGIVGWIGWTMATTPSPKPIEAGSEAQGETAATGKGEEEAQKESLNKGNSDCSSPV